MFAFLISSGRLFQALTVEGKNELKNIRICLDAYENKTHI